MSISALNTLPQAASQSHSARLASRGEQLDRVSQPTGDAVVEEKGELREAFDSFVGQTFYGLMLKTMRESTSKTPYFHGGRGEEVFQKQLDQIIVERMTDASAETFTGPMYDLFNLNRR